ncbi:MAG: roadblock/LC7 domain-containing protein [Gammaproteobacteria bacterium]|nr:roadblock/LC7 domain-containing protein [Gammaproteobacteria bacterium]
MSQSIADVLSGFLEVNGVKSVALVGRDGFVIESVSSDDVDTETSEALEALEALGAMVATAIGASETLGKEFNLGGMSQYITEFDNGKILIATAGNDILALFTDASAVIGSVRFAVRKRLNELLEAM